VYFCINRLSSEIEAWNATKNFQYIANSVKIDVLVSGLNLNTFVPEKNASMQVFMDYALNYGQIFTC